MTTSVQRISGNRMGLMLFIAAGLHLLLILGVSFEFNDRNKPEYRQQSLDVMLVAKPKELPKPDEEADFLAQTSQTGSGEETPEARPTQQIAPPPQNVALPSTTPTQTVQPVPTAPREVITQNRSERKMVTKTEGVQHEPTPKPSATQLLASRDREIAHLTAQLERRTLAYAMMPRRKSISASTKEYKYAAYLDAWRRKVERIGNLNYPDEAKRQKLYGNMILHVAVKSDGSVEQVRVLHSSGHQVLDDAAMRIVRLAAPFSPFPQEINQETDILDIVRTWQFTRSNRLGTR